MPTSGTIIWYQQIFKVKIKFINLLFSVALFLDKFILKSSFNIKNLILNMNDYNFSIQNVVQRCPIIASFDFLVLKALGNETLLH